MQAFRPAPLAIILNGQSLAGSIEVALQALCEAEFGTPPPMYDAWGGGIAWVQLATTPYLDYMTPFGGSALTVVVVQMGGTTDYTLGATGAATYANEVICAEGARTRGVDLVIGTTTTPSGGITGGNETERLAGNLLVIDDADEAFDAVAQVAEDPDLDDPTNSTFYDPDETHFTTAGEEAAAGVVFETLLTVL